jgi:hypothetical protein
MRYDRACAIDSRKRVACWTQGAPAIVPGIEDAAEVVVGMQNVCARTRAGRVACWGDNVYKELQRDGGASATPVWIEGLPPAEQIGTTTYGTPCIRAADGGVWCWGVNLDRSVRSTEPGYIVYPPRREASLEGARHLIAGHWAVCAVSDRAVCVRGALDRASPGIAYFPNPLSDIATAVDVAFGFAHACLVREDGRVACWGENEEGQLGDGTTTTRPALADVPGIKDAVRVGVGPLHTCILHKTGRVSCFGAPAKTPFTKEETRRFLVPTDVGLSGVEQLACGWDGACALLRDRSIVCWGHASPVPTRIGVLD